MLSKEIELIGSVKTVKFKGCILIVTVLSLPFGNPVIYAIFRVVCK